jgi:hypothetical protein
MFSQIGHINLVNYLAYLLCLFSYLPTYVLRMACTYLASTYLLTYYIPSYLSTYIFIYTYLPTYIFTYIPTYILHNQRCTFKNIGR